MSDNYLIHYGIKGQRRGVRRYQNEDGSLTNAGYQRYGINKNTSTVKPTKINLDSKTKTALDREIKTKGLRVRTQNNVKRSASQVASSDRRFTDGPIKGKIYDWDSSRDGDTIEGYKVNGVRTGSLREDQTLTNKKTGKVLKTTNPGNKIGNNLWGVESTDIAEQTKNNNTLKRKIQNASTDAKSFATYKINKTASKVKNTNAYQKTSKAIENAKNEISNTVDKTAMKISSKASNIKDRGSQKISDIKSSASNSFNKAKSYVSTAIHKPTSEMKSKTVAKAMDWIDKNLFTSKVTMTSVSSGKIISQYKKNNRTGEIDK